MAYPALADGAKELTDAADDLKDGTSQLADGTKRIFSHRHAGSGGWCKGAEGRDG